MAPSKVKDYCSKISKNDRSTRKVTNDIYFEIPPPVKLPKFIIPRDLYQVMANNLQPHLQMSFKAMQFLSILETLKDNELQVQKDNYLEILKLMVHIEHFHNEMDMSRYDQKERKIEKVQDSPYKFKIFVEGLEEDKPSVRPEDTVEIRDSVSKEKFLFTVVNVAKDYILVAATKKFIDKFIISKLYNVKFRYPDYTIRCSHYALLLADLNKLTPSLFPEKRIQHNINCVKTTNIDHWYNQTLKSNPEQKQAVQNIMSKSSYPAPYILYGPPGTGKTATLVEAICQIFFGNSLDTHVLICTPSNSAADEITKRLLKYQIPENNIYRMYSPSKEGSKIDNAIIGCSNYVDGQVMMLPKEAAKSKAILICTLCAAIRLLFMELKEKHFSYVFIDEAGQATEPETLIPLNLLTSNKLGRIGRLHGQVVIAGDPKQLGPSIRSKLAESILGRSLLERLMDCEPYKKNEHNQYNPYYITKLLRNYRSHREIINVSNKLFYENELLPCSNDLISTKSEIMAQYLTKTKFPVLFHGVEGVEEKENRSPSIFNVNEIKQVVNYAKRLTGCFVGKKKVNQKDIGIITPFAEQRTKIYKALQRAGLFDIDVGTVESFQGQEREIIIISTVRSEILNHNDKFHIGFLSNPKRFNVAVTRAKALLIVIGDPNVLKVDPYWRYFLNYCKINKACHGAPFVIEEKNMDEIIKEMYYEKKQTKQARLDLSFINMNDGVLSNSEDSSDEIEKSVVKKKIKNNRFEYRGGIHSSTSSNLFDDFISQKLETINISDSKTKKKTKV